MNACPNAKVLGGLAVVGKSAQENFHAAQKRYRRLVGADNFIDAAKPIVIQEQGSFTVGDLTVRHAGNFSTKNFQGGVSRLPTTNG
ncbi:MAG: hypothetical protein IJG80_08600 [Selenomonadaceae bacterium]|nr:hypothetical protein [Selenomonadaceae bacterium]MBQ3726737.1 hypothetical protein [Selenomonadaceae bacterium]MBQ9498123.1 hypothetical protein [Selenomonadaceae bacterium]